MTKHEYRNSKQAPMINLQTFSQVLRADRIFQTFLFLAFVSTFKIRISDF